MASTLPDAITILAIDDSPTNLSVLVDHLTHEDCRVLTAESAQSALNRLEYVIPDILLLDVMMPGMGGFELCRHLKAHAVYKDIPVIFLTAKNEREDILEGFEVGGVDYITKPFREEELSARIRTHIDLKRARNKVQEYAFELELKNRRFEELLAEKNEFIGFATHDLKNPLSVLTLAIDLFKIKTQDKPIEVVNDLISQMEKTLVRMTGLVNKLVEINRIDVGHYEINAERKLVSKLCNGVIDQNRVNAQSKQIALRTDFCAQELWAMVDVTAFEQIVDNLVSNAIKYSPPGSRVTCKLSRVLGGESDLPDLIIDDHKIRFEVIDNGPGIKDSEHKKVFAKFGKTSNQPTGEETSSGLGLSIAKSLARSLDGDLGFVSQEGAGSTFYLELPLAPEMVPASYQ